MKYLTKQRIPKINFHIFIGFLVNAMILLTRVKSDLMNPYSKNPGGSSEDVDGNQILKPASRLYATDEKQT